ncbi:hypothetical protein Ae168Ps1_6146 [Pseudonocardia sp. Ae168_Ps1]|nr:hypothetical protein Ae150APs1_6080 [Pseudonocardia sp. Ae150A_Ps1]OLL70549.1 hypothetical protein Ae263Ps1_6299 [Pseudonocardia sp. Ae263_Ps1]OLL70681.1 hypothetical protein Ae168Ps1_6146 [Pseudonocardia sp. Ae168_Ps1]OLL89222.1 hypothetical protein Ae356Ps1_6141c [Pseudonocardia sp. Ae356_Ps1]
MYCSLACVLAAAEDLKLGEREHAQRLGTPADAERDRARVLERAETMIRRGMSAKAAADVLRVPPAALRTWLKAAGIAVVPDPAETPPVTPVFTAPPPTTGARRAGTDNVHTTATAPADTSTAALTSTPTEHERTEDNTARNAAATPGKNPTGTAPASTKGTDRKGTDRKNVVPGGVKPGQDPVLGKYTSPRALLHHWRQLERITDLEIGAAPAGAGKSGHPQGFTATVSARLLVGDTAGESVVCTATERAKMKACDAAAYALAKILRPIMDAAAVAAAATPPRTAPQPETAPEPAAAPPPEPRHIPAGPPPATPPAAPSTTAPTAPPTTRSGATPDTRLVREWARKQGYTVGERGRLPTHIQDAYLAATTGTAPPP